MLTIFLLLLSEEDRIGKNLRMSHRAVWGAKLIPFLDNGYIDAIAWYHYLLVKLALGKVYPQTLDP